MRRHLPLVISNLYKNATACKHLIISCASLQQTELEHGHMAHFSQGTKFIVNNTFVASQLLTHLGTRPVFVTSLIREGFWLSAIVSHENR
jgi:hypothetical protein